MKRFVEAVRAGIGRIDRAGDWLSALGLRFFLAYEFAESGIAKYQGANWFSEIQDRFPFPFDLVPVGVSWTLATWSELLGAAALIVGLGTRFFSVALIILTWVAWYSVHAGLGYNVCDNGYKLPLIYLIMLLPLLLGGAGRLSLDRLIADRWLGRADRSLGR